MPSWYPDLASLGYEVNDAGQIRDKETGELYQYFETDNEKVNEVHNQAFHQAINKHLVESLRAYGVKETFLTGRTGRDVQQVRPTTAPHITILATDFKELKKKQNVVIIIPDSNQDLGILSYQELCGAGGFDAGSVLGIVKSLQNLDIREKKDDDDEKKKKKEEQQRAEVPRTPIHDGSSVARDFAAKADDMTVDDIPGVLVLNPGQLLYSHEHKVNMGIRSWTSRSGPHALSSRPNIDDEYNHVEGHASPQQHIGTVLRKTLQRKLGNGTRLFFVAVGDSADCLHNYMDHYLSLPAPVNMVRKHTTKALAMCHPTFDIDQTKSGLAKTKILSMGRLWMLSAWPLGTVTSTSETGVVEESYASEKLLSAPRATQQDLSSLPSPVHTEAGEDMDETFDKPDHESNAQPEGMLDLVNAMHKSAALPVPSDGQGKPHYHHLQDRHHLMGCSPPKNDGPMFPQRLAGKTSVTSSESRSTIASAEERRLRQVEAMRAEAIRDDDNASVFMPFQMSSISVENAGRTEAQKAEMSKLPESMESKPDPRPSDLPPRWKIPLQAPVPRSQYRNSEKSSWDPNEEAVFTPSSNVSKDSDAVQESYLMRGGDFDDDSSGMYMKGSKKINRAAGQDDEQPLEEEEYVMPASDIDEDRKTNTMGTSSCEDDALYLRAKLNTGNSADGVESAQSVESKDGTDDREPSAPDLIIEKEQSAEDDENAESQGASFDTVPAEPDLVTDHGSSDGGVSVDEEQGGIATGGSSDYPSDSESENESESTDSGVSAALADLRNTLNATLRQDNHPLLNANPADLFKPTISSEKKRAIDKAAGEDTDDDTSSTASDHNDPNYSSTDPDVDTGDTGIHFPDVTIPAPDMTNLLRVSGGCEDSVERILPIAQLDVLRWFKAMANRKTK